MPTTIDAGLLRGLAPLYEVSGENLQRLAQLAVVEEYPHGGVVCRVGDTDDFALYVIAGGVELTAAGSTLKRRVQAGEGDSSFPLAHTRPRDSQVTALPGARILKLENRIIDRLLVFDEIATAVTDIRGPEQRPLHGDTQWVEEMSHSDAFHALPREKFGPLMLRMEAVPVGNGEVVIRQGEPGDFYFVVKEGRFAATRKDEYGKVRFLSELSRGDVFGEEALISGEARNASIVALADGILMRLARTDFDELLRKPLIIQVSLEEARRLARDGAGLLDVRLAEEARQSPLKGGINIPVSQLRGRLGELDRARRYVVCCRTGVKSEVAAFLLRQRGFDVCVLEGGIEKHLARRQASEASA
jgi:CRP-like cAMP-binding protein